MFPHQPEELDAAFTDAKIGRGEGHLGVQRRLWSLRVILGRPAESFACPGFALGMKFDSEPYEIVQIRDHDRSHNALSFKVEQI